MNENMNPSAPLKPMEITSPRTAEQPSPMKTNENGCCDVKPATSVARVEQDEENEKTSYLPTIISLVILVAGILLDYFKVDWFYGYVRLVAYSIAYFLVGGKVLLHAVKNIANGSVFNEFLLMGIATLGAFYIGEYAEGVTVMLFYVIGEHFQELAVMRSRRSIKALIDNRPEIIDLVRNGQITSISPQHVKIGDIIQVKPGEKVALDGDLLVERSSFNTAALTGESKPDTKLKGEKVLAGMINLDQVIQLKVTSAYEDSALSKILQLVEQASSRKAKTQQFITRFAKIYTPVVVFLAIALTIAPYFLVDNYVFNEWLYRALIFLVISCPCALVISIPCDKMVGGVWALSS